MVATTPGDSALWLDRARRAAIVATIILFVAMVVAFLRTVLGTWHATGDHALIDLRTLDVGGSSTPLFGPYSRYGWSHPGPALFYALTPLLRTFGGRDIGILAGAIAINALALAAMLLVVWRRRDAAAWVIVVLIAAVLVRAPSAEALFDPWNPFVIVLPLLAAAVCAWSAAGGSRSSLVATVVLASFVAQSHIGAAPAALALVGYAFLWTIVDACRAHGDDRRRRVVSIVIALAAGFVVWLPPIVQAATSSGGNIEAIWEFWSASHPVSGFARGARFVAPQFAIPAPWMGATERTMLGGALTPNANRFPVALILLAVVTFFAARRRDREALALCSLAWLFALATWIAASRLVGIPFPYLLRWAWVAGALAWLAIAWCGWRMLQERGRPAGAMALTVGALVACGLALLVVVSAARTPYPIDAESRTLAALRAPTIAALRRTPTPILVESDQSLRASVVATGLLLDARRAGLPVRVPKVLEDRVDDSFALRGPAGSVLVVASDTEVERLTNDPAFRRVASYDTLDPAERRALTGFLSTVDGHIERLAKYAHDHPREYARLQRLKARDAHVAVFLRTAEN